MTGDKMKYGNITVYSTNTINPETHIGVQAADQRSKAADH